MATTNHLFISITTTTPSCHSGATTTHQKIPKRPPHTIPGPSRPLTASPQALQHLRSFPRSPRLLQTTPKRPRPTLPRVPQTDSAPLHHHHNMTPPGPMKTLSLLRELSLGLHKNFIPLKKTSVATFPTPQELRTLDICKHSKDTMNRKGPHGTTRTCNITPRTTFPKNTTRKSRVFTQTPTNSRAIPRRPRLSPHQTVKTQAGTTART